MQAEAVDCSKPLESVSEEDEALYAEIKAEMEAEEAQRRAEEEQEEAA